MYRNPKPKGCKISVLTSDLDFLLSKLKEKEDTITQLHEEIEALNVALFEPKDEIRLKSRSLS
jgi:peptidoglycan hydrolase CwlO-like protein